MAIIRTTDLSAELPTGYTATQLTNAANESSRLVNTWSVYYEQWPEVSGGVYTAPYEIVRACIEVAKALYYLAIGQVSRDGDEGVRHSDTLKYYQGYLREIEVEPEIESVAISVDSDGYQLIALNQHIVQYHPQCRVESAASPQAVWNQGKHWYIRRGDDSEEEYYDGWYLDASYDTSIEGTLYYARSWRNDGRDYQKYWKPKLSQASEF